MDKLPEQVIRAFAPNIREKIEKAMAGEIDKCKCIVKRGIGIKSDKRSTDVKRHIEIEEIRLRVNKPLILNSMGEDYFYDTETEKLSMRSDSAYIVTKDDIAKTFQIICKYSIHSFMDDIQKGFITLDGGHRVGIVGKTIMEGGKVKNMKHISSLNIRVSREVRGCADKVLGDIVAGPNEVNNTIIISPPQCGKTTILRDIVRNLSNGNARFGFSGIKVSLIDERNEIAGTYLGVPQMDVGMRTDVIDSCPKDIGISMLLRSMSPNVIVTDEIGSEREIESLYNALNGGVSLITTVHGNSIEDIRNRKELSRLIDSELFKKAIVLSSKKGPGTVEGIYDLEEKEYLNKEKYISKEGEKLELQCNGEIKSICGEGELVCKSR
ncbi:MAG: stage III sporulation protein AA [Clostridioides sp.]|jgi:stage III sporulation protein AA|nr:stage III sporulation protein AA [Clostridioides sp.]